MRPISLAAPGLAVLCLGATLQAPATPQTPTFPTQAEMVTVDVVVTDGAGRPVHGLTKDDFVIREDGEPQPLALFEAIENPTQSAGPSSQGAVSDNVTAAARPLVVVVFDEPHLTPGNVELARRQLREAASMKELAGTDVILASTTGGSFLVRLPEEQADFAAALARFRGARPVVANGRIKDDEAFLIASRRNEQVLTQVARRYMDLRLLTDPTIVNPDKGPKQKQTDSSSNYPAMGRSAILVEAEERWAAIRKSQVATVAGLTRLLQGLEPRRGRKAVLLVTEGFLQDGQLPEHRQMSEAARRARAAVNIIDPRDAGRLFGDDAGTGMSVEITDRVDLMAREMKSAEGADALAAATGGAVVRNLPGVPAALHAIGGQLRSYYLIGYEPKASARDGRFHPLAVQVTRPDVKVGARPGYYALAPGAQRADVPVPLSQQAIDAPLDASDLPVRLAGYVLGPVKKGKTRVRLVAEMDGATFAGDKAAAAVDAVFQLAPRERPEALQWTTVVKKPSSDKTVRVEAEFEAESGVYQARVLTREQGGSGRAGSVRHMLEVPPIDAFRASTPILTDLASGNVPVPRAERRFRRDGKLYCMIEVMGSPAGASVVAGVDLRQPDGNVRIRIPATPITSVPRSRLWAIPLTDLPPGAYDLMISVQEVGSNRTVAMREGFEVVGQD